MRSIRRWFGLALGVIVSASCSVPNFEGPQIQSPPQGFLLQEDSYQQRRMFPDREVTMHTAWIKAGNGPYSGIYVNAHPGRLTLEDVAEAQDQGREAVLHPEVSFSELEAMTIDGRRAWGWSEKLETPALGLDWVAYRTVVAYDTVSYAIEFYSGDPGMKLLAPDTLQAVIASFEVGAVEWNLPLLAMIIGLTVLGVTMIRARQKERSARLSTINLVKIEHEESPERGVVDLEEEPVEVPLTRSTPPPPPPPAAPTKLSHAHTESE